MDMLTDLFQRGAELHASGEAFAIVSVTRALAPTSAKSGDKAIVTGDGVIHGWIGGGCAQPAVVRTVRQALVDGLPRNIRITPDKTGEQIIADVIEFGMPCHSGGTLELFIDPVLPQQELVVLGDSPVAQALQKIAPHVGFRTTAREQGDATLDRAPAPNAFVVVATQGRHDLAQLQYALNLKARHIAFVASKRKGKLLKETLIDAGFERACVDAIEAPAGYPINAQTPEEIALSILAALVNLRRTLKDAPQTQDQTDTQDQMTVIARVPAHVETPVREAVLAIAAAPVKSVVAKSSCCSD